PITNTTTTRPTLSAATTTGPTRSAAACSTSRSNAASSARSRSGSNTGRGSGRSGASEGGRYEVKNTRLATAFTHLKSPGLTPSLLGEGKVGRVKLGDERGFAPRYSLITGRKQGGSAVSGSGSG